MQPLPTGRAAHKRLLSSVPEGAWGSPHKASVWPGRSPEPCLGCVRTGRGSCTEGPRGCAVLSLLRRVHELHRAAHTPLLSRLRQPFSPALLAGLLRVMSGFPFWSWEEAWVAPAQLGTLSRALSPCRGCFYSRSFVTAEQVRLVCVLPWQICGC